MTAARRSHIVLDLARKAGFVRAGVAAAGPLPRRDYLEQWLARGQAGEMEYLARHHAIRANIDKLLAGARSVVVVADLYRDPLEADPSACRPQTARPPSANQSHGGPSPGHATTAFPVDPHQGECSKPALHEPGGRVARYAWGRDYHRVLRRKLQRLADEMHAAIAEPFETRVCVDTAPLVEREWAAAAGVGWIGKNTLVMHEDVGSFFFLGEIVTTLDLQPSEPVTDRCGACTRCLDACPTDALIAPYQMDARRCISYLTIEHRAGIDADLQPLMGDWIFGCDACQDVCPHNRRRDTAGRSPATPPPRIDPAYEPNDRNPLPPRASLTVLRNWTDADHARHLAGSAMKRATLAMLHRNAAIAARNHALNT